MEGLQTVTHFTKTVSEIGFKPTENVFLTAISTIGYTNLNDTATVDERNLAELSGVVESELPGVVVERIRNNPKTTKEFLNQLLRDHELLAPDIQIKLLFHITKIRNYFFLSLFLALGRPIFRSLP